MINIAKSCENLLRNSKKIGESRVLSPKNNENNNVRRKIFVKKIVADYFLKCKLIKEPMGSRNSNLTSTF